MPPLCAAAPGPGPGCQYLAEGIARSASFTKLGLAWNGIDPEGVVALAKAFLPPSQLRSLNLSHNNVGIDGARALQVPTPPPQNAGKGLQGGFANRLSSTPPCSWDGNVPHRWVEESTPGFGPDVSPAKSATHRCHRRDQSVSVK